MVDFEAFVERQTNRIAFVQQTIDELYVQPVQYMREPVERRDVHTEHCCVIHGCKYGKEDECTVSTGAKAQSFKCELCEG
jgi:hypothetical protein